MPKTVEPTVYLFRLESFCVAKYWKTSDGWWGCLNWDENGLKIDRDYVGPMGHTECITALKTSFLAAVKVAPTGA